MTALALKSYEANRRPPTTRLTNESRMAGRLLHLENSLACRLRDGLLAMTIGTRLDGSLKFAKQVTSELSLAA